MWHYSLVCDKIHRKLFSCAASHLCSARLFHMCDRTLSYVWCVTWYYSFVCVARFICMCDKIWLYVWQDSFVCVACDVILLVRVWQDSFVCVARFICCVAWFICMYDVWRDITRSYVWQESFVRVARFICMCRLKLHICNVTHSYVRGDALYLWYDSFISMCGGIHLYVSLEAYRVAKTHRMP